MTADPRGGQGEAFQPIPVRPPSAAPLQFALRCALDLQMLTVYRFLKARLPGLRGRVLDAGAGEAPWRELMTEVDYVALDIEAADTFGMIRNPSVTYFDGRVIPFSDASFDHVMCIEVLEHVEVPVAFVAELARVLRPRGTLILTVPWSARLHHLPHDYHRFTRFALSSMLAAAHFEDIRIEARGNDVAVVANKLIVMTIGLLRPVRSLAVVWRWPLAAVLSPVAALFVVAAHIAMALRRGSIEDPLGYSVVATRS